MKLINNSSRNYIAYETILEAGKVLEIKDKEIVNILKKQPGVEEYVSKEDVEKLKKEVKELKEKQKSKEDTKKLKEEQEEDK